MLNVLFAALIGGFALGMAAPNFQYFATGMSAYARLLKVLNRCASFLCLFGLSFILHFP